MAARALKPPRVLVGDCLEEMAKLKAASVDAVVTDPPFFAPASHYQSRVEWGRRWSDMSILEHWWGSLSAEFARVLKPSGHVLVFCNADSYPAFYPPMFSRWSKLSAIVWDKGRPGLGGLWRHQHEFVIAASNRDAYRPADGRCRSDIVRCAVTPSKKRSHPVEKPIALLAELIEAVCPPGGIVLDPFAGSGTTGLAAESIGRNAILIERDPGYAAGIERKLAPSGVVKCIAAVSSSA